MYEGDQWASTAWGQQKKLLQPRQRVKQKARFYLHARQKGFPNTKRSPLKLNSLDEGYANYLKKRNL